MILNKKPLRQNLLNYLITPGLLIPGIATASTTEVKVLAAFVLYASFSISQL